MRAQRAVKLIELRPAGGCDGDGDAQVFAAAAFAQLDGAGIKSGIKLVRDVGDGRDQPVHFQAHHFDGELRRVLDQRFLLRCGRVVGGWRAAGRRRKRVGGDGGNGRCGHKAFLSGGRAVNSLVSPMATMLK